MPNPNYVCTLCSQTFTRRWRGSVHNANIHAGLAKTVRLLDYIIGRANGEYLPSDPSWYRKPNRHNRWTNGIGNAIYADRKNLPREDQSAGIRNFTGNRIPGQGNSWSPNPNRLTEENLRRNKNRTKSNLDPEERIIKLAELKRLASNYLPPKEVQDILSTTSLYCQQAGDNGPIDIAIEECRKKVKLRESMDYLNGSGS